MRCHNNYQNQTCDLEKGHAGPCHDPVSGSRWGYPEVPQGSVKRRGESARHDRTKHGVYYSTAAVVDKGSKSVSNIKFNKMVDNEIWTYYHGKRSGR